MSDHITTEPLWDERGFAAFLRGLVEDDAPRLFAVGLEYGERHDAHVAAYGMAFEDHTEVISCDGSLRVQTVRPEDVLRHFDDGSAKARLLWLSESLPTKPSERAPQGADRDA
ncbi:hypothetical protein FHS29_005589 [Saccharothrix tamanrassetensis]|uniref:Uncharacterized protein n=1 Tax=Saccharothrix tamanrassetensis TaxID=1051531 RepID=A0A841CP77_9PSEU|nr:hypothetical protein [Saccharothrix tamanrassetensis]MBB5958980.1 hypothetical protein [Saccharothrix tamanrassetensis]